MGTSRKPKTIRLRPLPLMVKWFSRRSWFVYWRGHYLATYYADRLAWQPLFKMDVGKLRIEWW